MRSSPATTRRHAPSRQFALVMGATVLLLAALLEAIFLDEQRTVAIFATLVGIPFFCLLFRFAIRIKRGEIDLFSPMVAFPAAYVVWFGLGSLAFLGDSNPPPYLYFVLGLLAYLAGTVISRRRGRYVRAVDRPSEEVPWNAWNFRLVILLMFIFMTGSYLLLIAKIGIPALHADVAFRREALGSHHYPTAVLISSATTLMLFSAADLWCSKRALKPYLTGGLIILATLMVGSFGNRGFVITPLLTLLVLWHYWRKPIPAGRLAVVLTLLAVASVGYDYTRAQGLNNLSRDEAVGNVLYSSLSFTLYNNLANFREIVQAIPSNIPHQHGNLTFGAVLQILPGHHESSDEFFRRILGSEFIGGGQPGTLLAPFYGDAGLAGILAGMFFFGVFSIKVYEWMRKTPSLFRVLLYSWFVQNALLSLYGALLTYIITLWLPFMWWMLDRWMRHPLPRTNGWRYNFVPSGPEA